MAYRIRCVLGILIAGSYVLGVLCWVSEHSRVMGPRDVVAYSAAPAIFLVILPLVLFAGLAVVFLVEMMGEGRRR